MKNDSAGVSLPEGETGSRFFHRILKSAADKFPSELGVAKLPRDGKAFKAGYGDCLVRFEAARIASSKRIDIARFLKEEMLSSLRLGDLPLREALTRPHPVPAMETRKLSGKSRMRAEVPFKGRTYYGKDVLTLVDKLHADHHMTDAAKTALHWIVNRIEKDGGSLDLTGEKFALLGAGAELSPVRLLLAAGATVLWIDVKPPERALDHDPELSGTIVHTTGDDLIARPAAAAAAIKAFGPSHIGLLAYAPGQSRELRIAGAMNAIVESLDKDLVKSVSMLISPTSPGELSNEDKTAAAKRVKSSALWMRLLDLVRVLPRPGGYGAVSRAIVSLQGQGYQAAQHLAKIITAEVMAADGITVSANVAGITNTRSLSHPLFQLAFVGAPAFGVCIFEPAATRALSGLLMLHDVLNPEAPGNASRKYSSPNERARAIRTEQIHGGVYALPWQFEQAVRVAAVLGLGRRPDLLLRRAA